MKILKKIRQMRCFHDHIEHDLTGVEVHRIGVFDENERISIKVWCSDCGKVGYGWYEFQEVEWK